MALENQEFKDQIGLICEGSKIVKREKKRGGRGRREEEEGEPSQKGMETTLSMELWILYGSHGIVSFICLNACLQI